MSVQVYEKDIEVLLQLTAHIPFLSRLSGLPIIGKNFECSDVILFRQKLKQAVDDKRLLTVDHEDIDVLATIVYNGATGGRMGDSVFNTTSPVTTVCQKILHRLYQEYPEYFEVCDD
jgi:hypothetical protein